MEPRTTNIEVEGQTVIVYYLMTLAEAMARPQDDRGAVASGMERRHLENARHERNKGRMEHARLAMHEFERWSKRTNKTWPQVARDLIAGLPNLDAFCVIPSSRAERRDPMRQALLERFPTAIELTYARPDGFSFGGADDDAIFQALSRTDTATLPQGACVGLVDDWAGGGTTLRAAVRRIQADHEADLRIICAVPGVSAQSLKPRTRLTE